MVTNTVLKHILHNQLNFFILFQQVFFIILLNKQFIIFKFHHDFPHNILKKIDKIFHSFFSNDVIYSHLNSTYFFLFKIAPSTKLPFEWLNSIMFESSTKHIISPYMGVQALQVGNSCRKVKRSKKVNLVTRIAQVTQEIWQESNNQLTTSLCTHHWFHYKIIAKLNPEIKS